MRYIEAPVNTILTPAVKGSGCYSSQHKQRPAKQTESRWGRTSWWRRNCDASRKRFFRCWILSRTLTVSFEHFHSSTFLMCRLPQDCLLSPQKREHRAGLVGNRVLLQLFFAQGGKGGGKASA